MGDLGSLIAGPARIMPDLVGMLASDIDADRFADRCGTTINHPAFIVGHITYYAGVAMTMFGGSMELADDEESLYAMGVACSDDASCYPSKDDALASLRERFATVADFIESCEDAVLNAPNDSGPFQERCATMGAVASFLLQGHSSFHLGQLSAWRRVAGMGSAMGA